MAPIVVDVSWVKVSHFLRVGGIQCLVHDDSESPTCSFDHGLEVYGILAADSDVMMMSKVDESLSSFFFLE